MALCHCQIKGCTVWWRGRGRWALMDWKGMCFSSKQLSVNKDSAAPALGSIAACWIPPYSPKSGGWEVTPMLPSPSWPLHLDFSFLWQHKYLAPETQRSAKSYSTFGFPFLCVKHNVWRHQQSLLSPSWPIKSLSSVKKRPTGKAFLTISLKKSHVALVCKRQFIFQYRH